MILATAVQNGTIDITGLLPDINDEMSDVAIAWHNHARSKADPKLWSNGGSIYRAKDGCVVDLLNLLPPRSLEDRCHFMWRYTNHHCSPYMKKVVWHLIPDELDGYPVFIKALQDMKILGQVEVRKHLLGSGETVVYDSYDLLTSSGAGKQNTDFEWSQTVFHGQHFRCSLATMYQGGFKRSRPNDAFTEATEEGVYTTPDLESAFCYGVRAQLFSTKAIEYGFDVMMDKYYHCTYHQLVYECAALRPPSKTWGSGLRQIVWRNPSDVVILKVRIYKHVPIKERLRLGSYVVDMTPCSDARKITLWGHRPDPYDAFTDMQERKGVTYNK